MRRRRHAGSARNWRQPGIDFVDAPVSGGEVGAIAGTLSIMAGGTESGFARAQPAFACMGKNIVHVGAAGAGQVAKAANQIVTGMGVLAVAEAFAFANKNGVDAGKVREALLGGFAYSRILENHGQRMLDRNFKPGFKSWMHERDFNIVMQTAHELGLCLPGSAATGRCSMPWSAPVWARKTPSPCSSCWKSCRGRHEGRLHRPWRDGSSDGPACAARRACAARLGTPSGKSWRGLPATICATPAELGRQCEVVFTVITSSADVEAVALGRTGLSEGMAPGSVLVDCSTIAPDVARHIAARLGEKGIAMLDAPVSGGVQGAVDATLAIMAGGEADVLARVRPLLQCLGQRIVHIGPNGAGQVAKACNQMIMVAAIQAVAEAMRLAAAAGVDCARVKEALAGGSAASRVLDVMGERMVRRNFAAGIESPPASQGFRPGARSGAPVWHAGAAGGRC